MIGFYGKFICPNCGKKFRQKIYIKKGARPEECQKILRDGSIFLYHVHCPRCEECILYKDRLNYK